MPFEAPNVPRSARSILPMCERSPHTLTNSNTRMRLLRRLVANPRAERCAPRRAQAA